MCTSLSASRVLPNHPTTIEAEHHFRQSRSSDSYVALIDADRLDYYHRLERERIHLLLIDDARRGLEDVVSRRIHDADKALAITQKRRASAQSATKPVKICD
jgi:hypothetical protein